MKIELDTHPEGYNRIDAYQHGQISINGKYYTNSLIVTPARLITDWPPQSVSDIALQHVRFITDLNPEIIIFGTGQQQCFLAHELLLPIIDLQIGYEIMDTGAACRSFNLLAGEERNIAVALIVS